MKMRSVIVAATAALLLSGCAADPWCFRFDSSVDGGQRAMIAEGADHWRAPITFNDACLSEVRMGRTPKGSVGHFNTIGHGIIGHGTIRWFEVIFSDRVVWRRCRESDEPGFDLPRTSAHEFGHTLGHSHSSDPDDVMYRFGWECSSP